MVVVRKGLSGLEQENVIKEFPLKLKKKPKKKPHNQKDVN